MMKNQMIDIMKKYIPLVRGKLKKKLYEKSNNKITCLQGKKHHD